MQEAMLRGDSLPSEPVRRAELRESKRRGEEIGRLVDLRDYVVGLGGTGRKEDLDSKGRATGDVSLVVHERVDGCVDDGDSNV